MASSAHTSSVAAGRESGFQNTLWSRVFAAGNGDDSHSRQAAEELCRLYWYPIYAFLRRWGQDRQNARDLAQGFFAHIFESQLLKKAKPDKGRFRSFLLGSLKNFVHNEHAREQAVKRGGGAEIVSIDEESAEGLYRHEPATNLTPEKLFDRRWALTVIQEAMQRLQNEYERAGMKDLYAKIQSHLSGDYQESHAVLAGRLNTTEGNARVLVSRARARFRQLLRAVVADTVVDLDQVDMELKHLQEALRER